MSRRLRRRISPLAALCTILLAVGGLIAATALPAGAQSDWSTLSASQTFAYSTQPGPWVEPPTETTNPNNGETETNSACLSAGSNAVTTPGSPTAEPIPGCNEPTFNAPTISSVTPTCEIGAGGEPGSDTTLCSDDTQTETYSYEVTALTQNGDESLPSSPVQVTNVTNDGPSPLGYDISNSSSVGLDGYIYNTLKWNAIPGVNAYDVYVSDDYTNYWNVNASGGDAPYPANAFDYVTTVRVNTSCSANSVCYADIGSPAPEPQQEPLLAPPTNFSATPSPTCSSSCTTWSYVVTDVNQYNDGDFTDLSDFGQSESYASAIASASNVSSLNGTDYNELSWHSVAGATEYNVYRYVEADNAFEFLATVVATSCTDGPGGSPPCTPDSSGGTYTYNDTTNSSYSDAGANPPTTLIYDLNATNNEGTCPSPPDGEGWDPSCSYGETQNNGGWPGEDEPGYGDLRLTSNGNYDDGGAYYQTAFPTSQGLAISFNSYQYDTGGGAAGDGIGFDVLAANPEDPTAPASLGPDGGSLGYSYNDYNGSANGVANGYLGFGLDVFGHFEDQAFEGTDCSSNSDEGPISGNGGDVNLPGYPSHTNTADLFPESVSIRGPGGDDDVGYCMLATTATYANEGGNNLPEAGSTTQYLDDASSYGRPDNPVSVQIILNPQNPGLSAQEVYPGHAVSGDATYDTSVDWGATGVPVGDWGIAVAPIEAGGAQNAAQGTVLEVGALPTLYTPGNNTDSGLEDFYGVPNSWVNTSTGLPYDLIVGWSASTGSAIEVHEVSTLETNSVDAEVPELLVGNTDNEVINSNTVSHQFVQGSSDSTTFTLTPSLVAGAGDEQDAPTMLDTIPAGVTLAGGTANGCTDAVNDADAPDWTCESISGSVGAGWTINWDYTGSTPIESPSSGSSNLSLGTITVVGTVDESSPTTSIVSNASIVSDDALEGTAADTLTDTSMTATATPSPSSTGTAVTLTATLPSGDGPTIQGEQVTFTDTNNDDTLCVATIDISGVASCNSSVEVSTGVYDVTATYPGDSSVAPATASTSYVRGTAYTVTYNGNGNTGGAAPTDANSPYVSGSTVDVLANTGSLTKTNNTFDDWNTAQNGTGTSYAAGNTFAISANTTLYAQWTPIVTMIASASPSSSPVGTVVTLSETGLPPGTYTPSEVVTFSAPGYPDLCTAAIGTNGDANCGTSTSLPAGTYEVTATYGSMTAPTSFTLTPPSGGGGSVGPSTTIALDMTADANPPSQNYATTDPVVLTATNLPTNATGTVTFVTGFNQVLCVGTVSDGSASCTTTGTNPIGTYPVLATYSGDSNYPATTATTSFVINSSAPIVTDATTTTEEDTSITMSVPTPEGEGPFIYSLVSGPPSSDGQCILSRQGELTFVPANGYTGSVGCKYRVTNSIGAVSNTAEITINVIGSKHASKGVAIPGAHTGEPWSGGLYWMLVGLMGIGGAGVLVGTAKRNSRTEKR